MKRKIIMLCGVLFLACGCTAVYDVDLTDTNIEEKLQVTGETAEDKQLLQQYNFYTTAFYDEQGASLENIKMDGVEYYDISHQNDLNMSYSFRSNNYGRSNVIHYCYENIEFQKNNKQILVSTGKKFNCFEMHTELTTVQINVHIPTDYELVSTNATIANGSLYQWVLTPDAQDNSIFLSLKKKESTSSTESRVEKEPEKKKESNNLPIILICLIGFVGVLFILIKWNKKKNGF